MNTYQHMTTTLGKVLCTSTQQTDDGIQLQSKASVNNQEVTTLRQVMASLIEKHSHLKTYQRDMDKRTVNINKTVTLTDNKNRPKHIIKPPRRLDL